MSEDFDSIDPNVRWIVSEARRPVTMDPSVRERLMDAIRAEELPHRSSRVLGWLLSRAVSPCRRSPPLLPQPDWSASASLVAS
jgi:hypothetical protein